MKAIGKLTAGAVGEFVCQICVRKAKHTGGRRSGASALSGTASAG